ncbi:beta-lactamase/transpeptidase-like protein [Aspergillus carlsbadensis]|nr:beta-lactamase/transpeptidase-like protein [Aspergillus carlsbadensis]
MSSASTDDPALVQRLEDAVSQIHQLKDIFHLPSISFGVLHHGRIILRESLGHRDLENNLFASPDTIYPIASCTKMFTSAAIGLLVDDGKLQWSDRVSKHLPDFNPRGDPRIAAEADLIDLLRHSTGVACFANLQFGPRECHLLDAAELIPLLNQMATVDAEGKQRFNAHWMYNSANFGLAAAIIERVSGQSYAEFVRSRILRPLGMDRTVVTADDIRNEDVVCQYTLLSDGATRTRLPTNHWPFQQSISELPGSGMGASLNDMLTWCAAVLAAERDEAEPAESTTTSKSQEGKITLKQMARLRRAYWTRPPSDPETSNEAAFGMGWMRMTLPTSMLGAYSGNQASREAPWELHLSKDNILGIESEKRVMIGHTGGAIGGIATVWTFPETQSAVCVMVNMRALGDASDFAAQVLIQALFDLRPRVDLVAWASKEAELYRAGLKDNVFNPWTANRRASDPKRECGLYVGEYEAFGGCFTLSISAAGNGEDAQLAVTFNHRERTKMDLAFFKRDTHSFFSGSLDELITELFLYRDYRQTLLEFELDDAGRVRGLWWLWSQDEERAWLRRV